MPANLRLPPSPPAHPNLSPPPAKSQHVGLRLAAALIVMPLTIFACWEWFNAGSPVLPAVLFLGRCCYFIVVLLLWTVIILYDDTKL